MGQGQPRNIIWTTLVVLTYTMLHTKFQGQRSIGSGEEDFLRFLPYMGMAAILVMWPGPFEQIFVSPDPWRLHMKFGYNWPSSFRGEVVWNCWRTTTDDDDGACLYYKLPRSLRLRWAKNPSTGSKDITCTSPWPWKQDKGYQKLNHISMPVWWISSHCFKKCVV